MWWRPTGLFGIDDERKRKLSKDNFDDNMKSSKCVAHQTSFTNEIHGDKILISSGWLCFMKSNDTKTSSIIEQH